MHFRTKKELLYKVNKVHHYKNTLIRKPYDGEGTIMHLPMPLIEIQLISSKKLKMFSAKPTKMQQKQKSITFKYCQVVIIDF